MSSTNNDSRALIPKAWEVNDLAEGGDKFTAVVVNSKNREQCILLVWDSRFAAKFTIDV